MPAPVLNSDTWADLLADATQATGPAVRVWRELAQLAIHRLAAREAEYAALQARYGRLLDEFRAVRASTRRAA